MLLFGPNMNFIGGMTSYSLWVGNNRALVQMLFAPINPLMARALISWSDYTFPTICAVYTRSWYEGRKIVVAYLPPEKPSNVD